MPHIDFLSFSFPVEAGEYENDLQARFAVFQSLNDLVGDGWYDYLATNLTWQIGRRHRPFSYGLSDSKYGITVMWNYKLSHAVMEVPGAGCAFLRREGYLAGLLETVQDRVIRIDIASDFVTRTRPAEFVAARAATKFSSTAHVLSETGETFYVGSRTSERFARVYRYEPPHPRAEFLRVEHEIKGSRAKSIVKDILLHGLGAVQESLGRVFGWEHSIWQVGIHPEVQLSAPETSHVRGETVRWLYKAVLPSLAKLASENRDAVEEFAAHVKKILDTQADNDLQ